MRISHQHFSSLEQWLLTLMGNGTHPVFLLLGQQQQQKKGSNLQQACVT